MSASRSKRFRRCAWSSCLALAAAASAPNAHASTCGKPDLLEAYPAGGAVDVPTNATLFAHYASTAEYLGEDISFDANGTAEPFETAVFDRNEGLLSVNPSDPLTPGTAYTIAWPALRGIGTATLGKGAKVTFTAGSNEDLAPPTFGGLDHVDWDASTDVDDCTNAEEDRFVFDVYPTAAHDDASTSFLKLVIFQTKGPHISAPEEVQISPFPKPGGSARVDLAIEDGVGDVCFAALVEDLAQQRSGGAEKEVCTKTTAPPFFYGCSAAPARLVEARVPATAWLLFSFLGRRRRRRAA